MWGMTAMKKGTSQKDKKKRAGSGAPSFGPFRIAPLSTIATSTAQSGWSHSGLDIVVMQFSTPPPSLANDAVTGLALGGGSFPNFTPIAVDDIAATVAASSPASRIHQTGGTGQVADISLAGGIDYGCEIEASVSPANQHSSIRDVTYTLDVIHDPSGLIPTKVLSFTGGSPPLQSRITNSPFGITLGSPFGFNFTRPRQNDVVIIEITAIVTDNGISSHTMTTETTSNLLNATASIKDSMYVRFNFL